MWIPAEQFSRHVASIKDSPFLFGNKVGGRRGSWLTAQRDTARLGWDERDFVLQVTNPRESGCRSGEVSLSGCPGFCVQHSPLREIQSSIDTAFSEALGKNSFRRASSHLSLFLLLWSTQVLISIFLFSTLVSTLAKSNLGVICLSP